MTSAARRTGPVRYPERRHSQCRFARRSDACRRGRPSCVPRFGASWSETLPEKRRWLNRQFVPTGRLYVRCGCRAVRLYPDRSSRPPPALYIPRHARPRRYRTSTPSRICTPGNPSRVGGDKRMGTRGAAKILPRCVGRSDRSAQGDRSILRSIRPKRATTSLAASVDPTDARSARALRRSWPADGTGRPTAARRDGYSQETKNQDGRMRLMNYRALNPRLRHEARGMRRKTTGDDRARLIDQRAPLSSAC